MTAKTLAAVLVAVLVASVAFVGPALAHGDAPTAPTNETTANETAANATWTGHATAWDRGQWPTWMGGQVGEDAYRWMAGHMGYGPQAGPGGQTGQGWQTGSGMQAGPGGQAGPGHGPGYAGGPGSSTQYGSDTHPDSGQYDDRQQTQWGGGSGYGC